MPNHTPTLTPHRRRRIALALAAAGPHILEPLAAAIDQASNGDLHDAGLLVDDALAIAHEAHR